jgi:predicted dehydrogenase
MIECVIEDRVPSVRGEDGRAALEIILAGYRSAREGREIIIG